MQQNIDTYSFKNKRAIVRVDFNVPLDENFKMLKESTTDNLGQYRFEVVCGKTYYVRVEKENYETGEKGIAISNKSNVSRLDFEFEKRIKPIGLGTDLAKTLNIPIIYFDLDNFISFSSRVREWQMNQCFIRFLCLCIDLMIFLD